MHPNRLNRLANFLIKAFEQDISGNNERGITVHPIVSEIASWYEKLRNVMDYREEEVIVRAAIERILKRRLILGGDGEKVAGPLIRELTWARYFPDGSITERIIERVAKSIDLHLKLCDLVLQKDSFLKEGDLNKWMYQIMSSDVARILNPNKEEEAISNFMYHVFKDSVKIEDDSEEAKNAQVFIAVHRAYARDDTAFLRYYLFLQYFGKLEHHKLSTISSDFLEGYREIEKQLNHPLRFRIHSYIKKNTPPFLILEDVLRAEKGRVRLLLLDQEGLAHAILNMCEQRYRGIVSKVQRAIVRSVFFILLTKAIFALAIEGTYENIVYGKVQWGSMALNILIPPLLMVIAGILIKTPGEENSIRILNYIQILLFDPEPKLGFPLTIKKSRERRRSLLEVIFTFLWLTTFILSFGLVMFILSKFHFNLISQGVFLFFLAIVSFLSYRIYRIAHIYTIAERERIITPVVDFFFMPVAQVGRYLTEGISQINIFLFILDFIIEAPFKGLFSFFEQWFLFLHAKREQME